MFVFGDDGAWGAGVQGNRVDGRRTLGDLKAGSRVDSHCGRCEDAQPSVWRRRPICTSKRARATAKREGPRGEGENNNRTPYACRSGLLLIYENVTRPRAPRRPDIHQGVTLPVSAPPLCTTRVHGPAAIACQLPLMATQEFGIWLVDSKEQSRDWVVTVTAGKRTA